ncbi:unnamed protein product [Lactuca virosa]|uniref:Glutaredoxin domain-containing protein n=1 Tax=Lactuca virosa TaxID=75947 RepID=A0AAU9NRW6_9ASTR|nr:unnamed protein product [Lactuca virosa]
MVILKRLVTNKAVVIFSKSSCCICHNIRTLICSFGANPTVYELDEHPDGQIIERELKALGCKPCTPTVFIGQELIGGANEMDVMIKLFVYQAPSSRSFFTEIIASISDIKFGRDGRYILSRDYMTLKLWDINMDSGPVSTFQVHEYLRPKLCDLYENDSIFDKFECYMIILIIIIIMYLLSMTREWINVFLV